MNNKTDEANAWVKKYFKDASVERRLLEFIIKGINDNKLISNPIQIPSQEVDEIKIKEPIIKVIKNNNLDGFLNIKKKRIITFINGV